MPSIAYTQLLLAALELGTFTAKDLADETALPLETIRTILKRQLKRQGGRFEDAGEDQRVASARRAGRPARSYRLRDPDAVRREVEAVGGLTRVSGLRVTERSSAERDSSVLDLALANLQVALTEDLTEKATAARIATAQRTASVVLEREDASPDKRARAHEYIAFGHIAQGLLLCDGQHMIDAMAAAAEHGAKAFELDPEMGRRVTRLLLAAAEKSGVDPPVAEMTTSVQYHDLSQRDMEEVELAGQTFRVPSYATPLMLSGSPAGLVVRFSGTDTPATVERTLERVGNLNVPTYVVLEDERDSDFTDTVQRATVSAAAYWMPAGSLRRGIPTAWIAKAFDRVVDLRADRVVLDAIERLPRFTESTIHIMPLSHPNLVLLRAELSRTRSERVEATTVARLVQSDVPEGHELASLEGAERSTTLAPVRIGRVRVSTRSQVVMAHAITAEPSLN